MAGSRFTSALVLLLAAASVAAPQVGAHSDEGEMTVVRAEQTGPDVLTVEVGIVYAGDEHLAEEATVSAVASTADTTLEPVPLTRSGSDSSVYAGEVPVPSAGTWTVTVESTGPTATATATVEVTEQATTTTESTTTIAPTTTQQPTDDTGEAADDAPDDDGSNTALLVVLGVVALAVVAGAVALAVRRREGERS